MNDKATILVVEDNLPSLKLLTDILKAAKYQVHPADSGELALISAEESPPDLIFLDISMPRMDGYEVCRRLKGNERLKDIPVIFLSAHNETMDKVKAFEVGGVDYVTKPYDAGEVLARAGVRLELRQQRQKLQENFEQLKRLEGLRDNLVHMVVHDMRSIIMVIMGALGLLQTESSCQDPAVQRFLDTGLGATNELNEMCNAVLDVSRLETGQMPIHIEPCDLLELITEATAATRIQAQAQGITVQIHGSTVRASADKKLIYRVLVNLLTNAIKHTPERDTVVVNLRQHENSAQVEVIDRGEGIAPEYQARVFEKFFQVIDRQEGFKHSTGLGLAFCKLAVDAHGGKIGVTSGTGKGSSFWFHLPTVPGAGR